MTQDVIPCLTPSPLDLARYRDVVLERFGNPYVLDTNQRVAADGFSKIPGFIAPTLVESFARGAAPVATAVLPALFLRFLERWARGTLPYAYQDGVMDESAARAIVGSGHPGPAVRRPTTRSPRCAQAARCGVRSPATRRWSRRCAPGSRGSMHGSRRADAHWGEPALARARPRG